MRRKLRSWDCWWFNNWDFYIGPTDCGGFDDFGRSEGADFNVRDADFGNVDRWWADCWNWDVWYGTFWWRNLAGNIDVDRAIDREGSLVRATTF